MLGRHEVVIESKKLRYHLSIRRNITIIRGKSGTGKTVLINMILNAGKNSPYTITCDKDCIAFTDSDFKRNLIDLSKYHDSIIFLDEDVEFVRTVEFADAVKKSDCYFVIITRETLPNLPYACKEIYYLENNQLVENEELINNDAHAICESKKKSSIDMKNKLSCIIVEDSNAGYQFFKAIADKMHIDCISARGNSKVSSAYKERLAKYKDTGILIVVDAAAFGAYVDKLRLDISESKITVVYYPESFEYILLSAGLFHDNFTQDQLIHTYNYVDSSKYFSWERYFTALLIQVSQDTDLKYTKKSLNKAYLYADNLNKIKAYFKPEMGIR